MNATRLRALFALALTASLCTVAACGDDGDDGGSTADTGVTDTGMTDTGDDTSTDAGEDATEDAGEDATEDTGEDAGEDAAGDTGEDTSEDAGEDAGGDDRNPDCDPLVEIECALPWPSNLYLEDDADRVTGYTLGFGETSLPVNFQDVQVRPDPFRYLDGYGVSTPIIAHWPNLDASELPNEQQVPASLDADASILFFAVREDGLERVPYWAELDDWESDPVDQVLWVRPGVVLEEATRYVVAFRDLQDTDGAPIEAGEAFAALRDGTTDGDALLAPRQARFDEIFGLLEAEGVDRDDLVLAWDFVTASSDAMHGRMLHIRDLALDSHPDGSEIVIENVTEYTEEQHLWWARVLTGYIESPSYIEQDVIDDDGFEVIGWVLTRGEDGMPVQNGTNRTPFWIGIPHSAMDGTPHRLVQYGHGFFGEADGTTGHWTSNGHIANEANYIFFGSNWTGMADDDFGNVQYAVFDMNHIRWLPERVHQGMIEFILFARAMREQFPAFDIVVDNGIEIDTDEMYYLGISQGGINGATYMALSPDIARGHLGVPGANYGLMEHRSTNFDQFFTALAGSYPGRSQQAVLLAMVNQLWDATDPISYWRHITAEPFGDDAPRYVHATPSKGDRQVTTISMEVVARTPGMGLAVLENYDPEREIGLVEEVAYPHTGSGLVLYNFGNDWPTPGVNRPVTSNVVDAHDAQRWQPEHWQQIITFFQTGDIVDTCGEGGCHFTPEEWPGRIEPRLDRE